MPDHLASPDHRDDAAASMARFALDGANDVLQLGSGPASPALYLAKEHGRHVTCAGSDRAALEAAESAGLPAIETDFDDETWDAALHGSSFDVVILAGILEEVRDPLGFLDRLLTAGGHPRRLGGERDPRERGFGPSPWGRSCRLRSG